MFQPGPVCARNRAPTASAGAGLRTLYKEMVSSEASPLHKAV